MKKERLTSIWTEREGEEDPDVPQNERDKFFESLPLKSKKDKYLSEDLRTELGKKGYEEWITHPNINPKYPLSDDLPKNLKSRKAQRKYEIFCGGFLYFYDVELEKYPKKIVDEYPNKFNGAEFGNECYEKLQNFFTKVGVGQEHKIFFEWGINKENDNKFSVRIYINPPAGNPDPPTTPGPPPPESSN